MAALIKSTILPFYLKNLSSYASVSDDELIDAICFFCDFIDLINNTELNMILELNAKFIEIFKAKDDVPDVKQSALFGIGIFATYLPKPTFSLYLPNITSSILD